MSAPEEGMNGDDGTPTVRNQLAEVDRLKRLKLRFEDWFCDKEPYGLVPFMASMSSVITSLRHCDEVEDFLDKKTDRRIFRAMMMSSLITDDPDFRLPLGSIGDPMLPKNVDPSTQDARARISPGRRASLAARNSSQHLSVTHSHNPRSHP